MSKTLTLLLITLCTNLYAQDYSTRFKDALNLKDTTKQLEILQEWEKNSPKDAELYISFFNYHFNRSIVEFISIDPYPTSSNSMEFSDSLGNVTGYFNSNYSINKEELQLGINYINRGIKLHPNRLDMRFGKVYAYGESEDWEAFKETIIATVKHSKKNKNKWLWAEGESLEDPKEFMLTTIQSYVLQLYDTNVDSLLLPMREIALSIIDIYPRHVESYSNIGITYLLTQQYDLGLEALLDAEKINPEDAIVLSNIAQAYVLKQNNSKAIEYYEKAIQYGDAQTIAFAKSQIEKLKSEN